jgi:hypothetical protein
MAAVTPVTPSTPAQGGEVDDVLEDINNDVSDSYATSLRTALNHFSKYLKLRQEQGDLSLPLDHTQLVSEHVTDELLGKFASYLMKKTTMKKGGSVLAMLSKVKVELHRRFCDNPIFGTGARGYGTLRTKITRRYLLQCAKDGTKLTDHSVPMTEMDLRWMCRKLLSYHTWEGIINRCLLVLQWQCMGRITEVAALKFADMAVVNDSRGSRTAMKIHITRVKTGVQQDMLVFLHAEYWEICPIHALACLVLCASHPEEVFSTVAAGNEANHTNR